MTDSRQSTATLTVIRGPEVGMFLDIGATSVTMGRYGECDIQVRDALVSRWHARVSWNGIEYIVEDLGSTNGTYVNGQRIGAPRALRSGDRLQLGEQVEFAFQVGVSVPSGGDAVPASTGSSRDRRASLSGFGRRSPRLLVIAIIAIAALAVMFFVMREDISILPPRVSEPAYIKDLVGYEEGSNGLVVYFVLADLAGREIAAKGEVELTIFDTVSVSVWDSSTRERVDSGTTLYSTEFLVTGSSFQKTKVGLGAYERTRVVCSFGRIPFSVFSREPRGRTGRMVLKFTPLSGSEPLEAEETIIW